MLRAAAKRAVLLRGVAAVAAVPRATINRTSLSTSTANSSQTSPSQTPTLQIDPSLPRPETPYYVDSTPSQSPLNDEAIRHQRKRRTSDYQEEQARVLQASLRHVVSPLHVENLKCAASDSVVCYCRHHSMKNNDNDGYDFFISEKEYGKYNDDYVILFI